MPTIDLSAWLVAAAACLAVLAVFAVLAWAVGRLLDWLGWRPDRFRY